VISMQVTYLHRHRETAGL